MGVSFAQKIAGLAFLALFPLFYFYHFAVSSGLLPPVIGGWHGPMTAMFVAPLLLALLTHQLSRNTTFLGDRLSVCAIALIGYSALWLTVHYWADPFHVAHAELATAVLAFAVYFCTGALINLDWHFLQRASLVLWLIMALLALEAVGGRGLMADVRTADGEPIYQGLARSMMLVSALVVACQMRVSLRLLMAAVSIAALFVIGARSELYGFIGVYALAEFFANRRSALGMLLLGIAVLAFAITVLSYFDALGASRQLRVFSLESDNSWRTRQYFETLAWTQIAESPLGGVYGGHWNFGQGAYAHSAISAWVSLGLIGFLLYVGACVLAAWRGLAGILANPQSPMARFTFMIATVSILLILVAKPVFWAVPALAWGLAMRPAPKRQKVRRRVAHAA